MAEAAAWYDDRVAGLGERFLLEAEAAFARIDEKPLTGQPWKHRRLPEGVRRMFMRSFPYSAVYILEPRVVVVALVRRSRGGVDDLVGVCIGADKGELGGVVFGPAAALVLVLFLYQVTETHLVGSVRI